MIAVPPKAAAASPKPPAAVLTHFARASRTGNALDNLVAILRNGSITGSPRMISGKKPAVCLFDVPIAELSRLLTRANRRRYQPFGVALEKRYAFAMGARPVIYIPLAEARAILASEELWRVVAIDLRRTPSVDWTFEHEWRMPGELPLPARGAVALVETWRDADELYDRFDGTPPCAGVIPLDSLFGPGA
jgi:hypothetical protein